jgi:hypothetical protein
MASATKCTLVGVNRMVIKTAETIKPGDIFVSEYGDYGNTCKFVFVACRPYSKKSTEIDVHNINNNTIYSIYELNPIDKVRFEVIGNENTDNS